MLEIEQYVQQYPFQNGFKNSLRNHSNGVNQVVFTNRIAHFEKLQELGVNVQFLEITTLEFRKILDQPFYSSTVSFIL